MSETPAPPNAFQLLRSYWPLIAALVIGAGGMWEGRYRLEALEAKVSVIEKQNNDRFDTLTKERKEARIEMQKMNRELRDGLGRVQLSMARICTKLDVDCGD